MGYNESSMEMIPQRNPFAGAACFLVKETDSTMRDALGLARMGFPAGSLVAADFQTGGARTLRRPTLGIGTGA